VDQIAVSGVDFDHVETGGGGALGRESERGLQCFDLVNRQFVGLGVGIAKRNGTRSDRTPPLGRFGNGALPRSGSIGAALSSCVCELDTGARALGTHKAGNPLKGFEMPFAPDAEILRRNAALGSDGSRLCEQQRRSTDRPSREMREMPIVRVAVDTGILAHWRNADAVCEVNVAHTKFAEQMRHGSIVSIENDGESTVASPAASIGGRDGGAATDHILRRRAVKPTERSETNPCGAY
jgi:hypothetical protein